MVFIENDAKLLLQRLPDDIKNVHYHDDATHIRLLLEKYGLVPKPVSYTHLSQRLCGAPAGTQSLSGLGGTESSGCQ